ncbi:MAG: hypothetical protein WCK98_06915 [bacterium]
MDLIINKCKSEPVAAGNLNYERSKLEDLLNVASKKVIAQTAYDALEAKQKVFINNKGGVDAAGVKMVDLIKKILVQSDTF